ncbi:hypothetical protein ABMY12_20660 [Vibrio vulnificus]|uniref:hypothetical protein n=1 Tax=Vibrio vulnificus TaxID=672 RepID=UPI0040598974
MSICNKIQLSVLVLAVALLVVALYSITDSEFKKYSTAIFFGASFLGFSVFGLGVVFSRVRTKKLHRDVEVSIGTFFDEQEKVRGKRDH